MEYRDELTEEDFGQVVAVFRTVSQAKAALKASAKENALCAKLLGVESGSGPCFASQLGKCLGACMAKEAPAAYNARFDAAFEKRRVRTWPFPGAIMLPEDPRAEEGTVYVIDKWRVQKVAHLLRPDVRARLVPYETRDELLS